MRKRAKHNLSHYRMHTGEMGELLPVGCVPVLAGDTIRHSLASMIRLSPLNTPVMHPTAVRVHSWFLPYRVLWPKEENGGWEEFITGGPDGLNAATPPKITVPGGSSKKALSTYLGVPPSPSDVTINAFANRAYNLIWNTRYRDQDLQAEVDLDQNTVLKCAWEKDYFTTARPFTSKGNTVGIPVAGQAPVKADVSTGVNLEALDSSDVERVLDSSGAAVQFNATGTGAGALYADLEAATAVDVNDFRVAFSLQRYQEARARYGSRFTEYLRYCGITPSDARIQEPEFLGGGTGRLQFSEVLQTTPADGVDENGVGDLYGHGIAGTSMRPYQKFFEEHGVVLTLMSIRPKSLYLNGTHREFFKSTKEDYYQKELANLGQQEVFRAELDVANSPESVFGYQDRYDEYRQHWSYIGQDFRDTLSSWHMGRDLSTPSLNATFVRCEPSKDIFQVTSGDPCWIMVNHKMVARRLVPKRANPRII